jgi:hypothetical protein
MAIDSIPYGQNNKRKIGYCMELRLNRIVVPKPRIEIVDSP